MIAKERIEVIIGGVLLAVPAGGVVHPAIIEHWRVSGSLDRAIAQGVIEDDAKPEPRADPARRNPYKAKDEKESQE